MDVISTFMVSPSLPNKLQHLQTLAYNIWWAWNLDAVDLFRRLDPDLWETSGHNPVMMLGTIKQERLEQAAQDEGYVGQLESVYHHFQEYLKSKSTWFHRTFGSREKADGQPLIAYFSMEYGLTEALPVYSGGLGVLSGDHLKASSDLGVPLVGVGLFYQQGYFRQYLNAEGWQQERYPINDFYNLPAHLERKPDGSPVLIEVEFPNGPLYAQIWRVQVGRVNLIMLDTNIAQNRPEYRDITDQLYGGDNETRIQQEILLGIGGIRALEALNLHPTICHMNEGHAAFLGLERWRILRNKYNLEPAVAREIVAEGSVFTTHTNVPAAIDIFHPGLMDKYFANYYPQLGIGREEFLSLGRQSIFDTNESFSMPVLAMRLSSGINGVSQLHGQVARGLWNRIWTGTPEQEVPIGSITNGIHARSFASHEMDTLLTRYLGPRWIEDPADKDLWKQLYHIPDEELWQAHEVRRAKLVAFARRRLRQQLEQRGAPQTEILQAMEVLHPDTLTIGFARRFATYKRATLIFRDLERLARILNNRDMPVQIIFSGKAHPHDNLGKELIRQIFQITRRDEFRRKIIFLEDYDLVIARYLVQGVDVWLNTPTRPLEASGTSGMKAALNGGLNFSTLDGWWAEAYNPSVGWAIGHGESYSDPTQQDEIEARAFYEMLEKEIVPLFYQRGPDGLPRGWISKMKSSISEISPVFNANRMVREYTQQYYIPVSCHFDAFMENNGALARDFTNWKTKIYAAWPRVKVLHVERKTDGDMKVNQEMQVEAQIDLAGLSPSDVSVQLYHGIIGPDGQLVDPVAVQMHTVSSNTDVYTYEGRLRTKASGLYGYALRILPYHPELSNPHELGVVHWAPSSVTAS